MGKQKHRAVHNREALDPATPPLRLIELMRPSVDAVLQNLALPLLLLEHPRLWGDLGLHLQCKVARSPHCPEAFAAWALQQADAWMLHNALLRNPALPAALRREVFRVRSPQGVSWPAERACLIELFDAESFALLDRAGLGRDPAPDAALTGDESGRLAALGRVGLMLAVRQPSCPEALLAEAWSRGGDAQRWVLHRPDVSDARLTEAATSPEPELRRGAATHPRLAPALLDALAANPFTAEWAAANPALPEAWVQRLLTHPDAQVRRGLAYNPALSPAVQAALAEDDDWEVRTSLRLHPQLTDAAEQRLAARDERDALHQASEEVW